MNFFLNKLSDKTLSFTAYLLMKLIGHTCKIKFVNEDIVKKEKEKSKGVIYAFWHGRQFLLIFSHRFRDICIMTSFSRDGELQTNIIKKLGYKPVRGSHNKRGAIEGTLDMIKLAKEGNNIAFAVDGPKGPVFKVKDGVLFIARKINRPIIPITSSAKNRKIFNNWDKYLFPVPFSKCVVVHGNTITINENDSLEEKALELENELNRITEEADRLVDAM
ncbi:MAG: lysophospholipid acyltransferase family protein [Elusimicrobia bacterium]|nr:lysophospholipid acyltransferase family protein [Elusimicrobiota bacterium]MBU2614171.1 lysophospholipid acyltransferase family protein [Elusimicrobiota bacterium]